VSLLLLLYRASRPRIAVLGRVPGTRGQYADVEGRPENEEVRGVKVLRVEGGLFFANADTVRTAIRRHAGEPGVHTIVLDAETIPFVDVSAVRALDELGRQLEREEVRLLIARNIGQVRDVVRTAGQDLGRLYPTVEEAVQVATRRGPVTRHG
jgi:SulP family sulfate permease